MPAPAPSSGSCGAFARSLPIVLALAACTSGLRRRASDVESTPSPPTRERITAANADRVALLHTLTGHEDWARCLAFRPDGRALASGGRDGTVRTFDPAAGTALATWRAAPC